MVTPEDFLAYIAAVVSHPGFTATFAAALATPGVRVPLTAASDLYREAVEIGREVIWLHTYGERFSDPANGRPTSPPRLPAEQRPKVLHPIPDTEDQMPEEIGYDEVTQSLHVGEGRIAPVPRAVWTYEVSGMRVIRHWFGYRKRNPAGRRGSPLDDIKSTTWTPEMTTELLNLLNVLGRLVEREPRQNQLLARVLATPLLTVTDLTHAAVLPVPQEARKPVRPRASSSDGQSEMF